MRSARRRLIAACLAGTAAPALAQQPAPAPVGLAACDSFLAAYEACIHTRVPEAARAALLQNAAQTRASWRDALARDAAAHRTVAAQCRDATTIIGGRLRTAYECAFEEPLRP